MKIINRFVNVRNSSLIVFAFVISVFVLSFSLAADSNSSVETSRGSVVYVGKINWVNANSAADNFQINGTDEIFVNAIIRTAEDIQNPSANTTESATQSPVNTSNSNTNNLTGNLSTGNQTGNSVIVNNTNPNINTNVTNQNEGNNILNTASSDVKVVSSTSPNRVVNLSNNFFSPDALFINLGNIVEFNNLMGVHTVTLDRAGIDRVLGPGQRVYLQFNKPGNYLIYSRLHGQSGQDMHMNITVRAQGANSSMNNSNSHNNSNIHSAIEIVSQATPNKVINMTNLRLIPRNMNMTVGGVLALKDQGGVNTLILSSQNMTPTSLGPDQTVYLKFNKVGSYRINLRLEGETGRGGYFTVTVMPKKSGGNGGTPSNDTNITYVPLETFYGEGWMTTTGDTRQSYLVEAMWLKISDQEKNALNLSSNADIRGVFLIKDGQTDEKFILIKKKSTAKSVVFDVKLNGTNSSPSIGTLTLVKIPYRNMAIWEGFLKVNQGPFTGNYRVELGTDSVKADNPQEVRNFISSEVTPPNLGFLMNFTKNFFKRVAERV